MEDNRNKVSPFARKEAAVDWNQVWEGMKNPLAKQNGKYNYAGTALVGGGTALSTYLLGRLLGMKNGPSLVASLLGGLAGTHYAMGKQHANGGQYDPFSVDWMREIMRRRAPRVNQTRYNPENGRIEPEGQENAKEVFQGVTAPEGTTAPQPEPVYGHQSNGDVAHGDEQTTLAPQK